MGSRYRENPRTAVGVNTLVDHTPGQVAGEFELTLLRHRVPISSKSSPESSKSPPQRAHLQRYSSGESHGAANAARLAAGISVVQFGATVWAGGRKGVGTDGMRSPGLR